MFSSFLSFAVPYFLFNWFLSFCSEPTTKSILFCFFFFCCFLFHHPQFDSCFLPSFFSTLLWSISRLGTSHLYIHHCCTVLHGSTLCFCCKSFGLSRLPWWHVPCGSWDHCFGWVQNGKRGTESRSVPSAKVQTVLEKTSHKAHNITSRGQSDRNSSNELMNLWKIKINASFKINLSPWKKLHLLWLILYCPRVKKIILEFENTYANVCCHVPPGAPVCVWINVSESVQCHGVCLIG